MKGLTRYEPDILGIGTLFDGGCRIWRPVCLSAPRLAEDRSESIILILCDIHTVPPEDGASMHVPGAE